MTDKTLTLLLILAGALLALWLLSAETLPTGSDPEPPVPAPVPAPAPKRPCPP